jgi:hypothetical protein
MAAIAAALAAAPAQAEYGFANLEVRIADPEGLPSMQAGSHPFAVTTDITVNSEIDPKFGRIPSGGQTRDLTGELPVGFVGSPTTTPRCSGVDFATPVGSEPGLPACSDSSVIGLATIEVEAPTRDVFSAPVYNLAPPPGTAAKFGFIVVGVPVTVEVLAHESYPYNLHFASTNITQMVRFYSAELEIWGNPSDSAHDEERGACGATWFVGPPGEEEGGKLSPGKCETSNPNRPFLTLPRSCTGPLPFSFQALAWNTGAEASETVQTLDNSTPPQPIGLYGCEFLGFSPEISTQPTSQAAESPTGLDVSVDVEDEGLTHPGLLADSDIEAAAVTLPAGMTINPSQAEGLTACSEGDLARERANSPFSAGCPAASKIGTVEVETPLLEGTILKGSLFVATPYENLAEDSLIALYMVIREPQLGLIFKLPGKVTPNESQGPDAGRLTGTFERLPQYPFSHFRLHFREGGRSPLVTPPTCGTYTTKAVFTPTANPGSPYETTSTFQITSGPGGGPCPAAGIPPFNPGFEAGSLNNDAGRYSPFSMRLLRRDGEQDLTKFSATLPPGVTGKIAGVDKCPPAQIALAKTKSARAELKSPSCPANSRIGSLLTGAGVGGELTYVPGTLYLGGPYRGDPLSAVAVVPALAGPFDVGTVVVQVALTLNPRTAEVEVDGAASDPIPHTLKGIVLKVRDIRVNADRSGFTLNPTSCDPSSTRATVFGSFLNVFSPADDVPVALSSRYQAAGCASLGFKPKLSLVLKGGTRRGAFPKLRGTYEPRAGDANLRKLVLRLPHSAFLEQGHFGTICTRVQYAQKACPAKSIYGQARVFTPLLSEHLEGPVYLRSSNHNLPDLVIALHGVVDIEASARIDSKNGGIRATFAELPDAPLSKAVVNMQGGRKGLIVNSTDLCAAKHRADANFTAQSGKGHEASPEVRAKGCGKKGKRGG